MVDTSYLKGAVIRPGGEQISHALVPADNIHILLVRSPSNLRTVSENEISAAKHFVLLPYRGRNPTCPECPKSEQCRRKSS